MHTVTDPKDLTSEQTELIMAASRNRGRLSICVRSDTNGRAVRGKDERFFDPDDRQLASRYIDTLMGLEKLLLVRQNDSRGNYELTNFGWLICRKLHAEE